MSAHSPSPRGIFHFYTPACYTHTQVLISCINLLLADRIFIFTPVHTFYFRTGESFVFVLTRNSHLYTFVAIKKAKRSTTVAAFEAVSHRATKIIFPFVL